MSNNKILISFENLSISIENKQNKIDNNSKYIFVRLYNTKYKKAGVGSKFLDFGQKATASSKWKVISNHAAISMNLQDKFYGMTVIDGDPTLKIEQCSKKHKYSQNPYSGSSVGSSSLKKGFINDDTVDIENSVYHVYAFKCNDKEYDDAKTKLAKAYYNKNFKFDTTFAGLNMTLYSICRKIKEMIKGEKNQSEEAYGVIHKKDATENVSEDDFKTVKKICSTFCAYILTTSIEKLKKHFNKRENKKSSIYVSPSDIPNFPGAIECFSGKFCDYDKDARKFVKEHEEFRPYL